MNVQAHLPVNSQLAQLEAASKSASEGDLLNNDSYRDIKRLATLLQENSVLANTRPVAPISRRVARSSRVAARRPSARPSGVGSTYHPQPFCRRLDQGVPVVVRTGNPCASASATTMPKLSE